MRVREPVNLKSTDYLEIDSTWNTGGDRIVAKTSIGWATLNRLDLNDDRHDDGSIQRSRRLWMRGGWHPLIGDAPNLA